MALAELRPSSRSKRGAPVFLDDDGVRIPKPKRRPRRGP